MSIQSLLASVVASLLLGGPLAATTTTPSLTGSPANLCEYIPWWPGC